VALAVAVGQQRRARLPLHVDETRRHNQARGIDLTPGACRGEVADRRDAIAADADIGAPRGLAAAVDHLAASNDHVERRFAPLACRPDEACGHQ
jgi:hypothetical protein